MESRVVFLRPLVGDFRARHIAVFTGSLLIFTIAFLFRGWINARRPFECLAVGAVWVLLTVAFEIGLGRLAMDLTWDRLLSDYDITRGGLMLIGLCVLLSAPLIVSRLGPR